MRFHQTTNHRMFQATTRCGLLFVLLLVTLGGQAVWAQGRLPSMTFGDSPNARYRSSGSGIAFPGYLSADVDGRISGGELTSFSVDVDPDINGPNGFRRFQINYRKSPAVIAPTVRWYDYGSTKKLVISRVRATEYFSGTGIVSNGYADVEITFVTGGAGRMVIRYTHSTYSAAPSNPNLRFNGTVCDATPLAGHRLYFTLN